jgi:uncharacterized protein (TIGR00369 family)
MDFRIVTIEAGRVVFEGRPSEAVYNPIGTVHGGFAATLLDSACGCVVHSMLGEGQSYTTLELKVAYHRPIKADTGPVYAEGKIISMGRRAAWAEARLTDAAGRLYATATSSLLICPLLFTFPLLITTSNSIQHLNINPLPPPLSLLLSTQFILQCK